MVTVTNSMGHCTDCGKKSNEIFGIVAVSRSYLFCYFVYNSDFVLFHFTFTEFNSKYKTMALDLRVIFCDSSRQMLDQLEHRCLGWEWRLEGSSLRPAQTMLALPGRGSQVSHNQHLNHVSK